MTSSLIRRSSTPAMSPNGDTYSFTFTAAGTYPYHCSIHPNMVGTIVIDSVA